MHEASPNWSECTCGRNTYCRFRPFSTAEATQVLIQKNFFAASTFAASGTQCALENTPMMRSTFCSLSSRSASLIATSVFDCASAAMNTILLPSTPPRSLIRSIAILLPIAAAFDPPPANGPV